MKTGMLRFPSLSRGLQLAAITTTITLLVFYAVFVETDYGTALVFTYDEVWDAAEGQEAAGHLHEAERLIRHIVAMEEGRSTLRFGLFALFAGPSYLVEAKLKLARLQWRHGHLDDADRSYRETLAAIADISGPDSSRMPVAEFRYAQFLAGTGRRDAARDYGARAEAHATAILGRGDDAGGPPLNEDEEAHRPTVKALAPEIARLRAELAR